MDISAVPLWYGYTLDTGEACVKRYFDQGDITEAENSDFVDKVYGPWPCADRQHAIDTLMFYIEGGTDE